MKRKQKMIKRAREYRKALLEAEADAGNEQAKISAELISLRAVLAHPTANTERNRRKRGIFKTASGKIIRTKGRS